VCGERVRPVVLVVLAAALNLPARDAAATAASAATAPASAPASAPAGPSPAQLVVKIISESDAKARLQAAVAILRIGSAEGVETLLSIFNTANNEPAKLAVCGAIAEVGSNEPAFRTPLLALLEHKNGPLREAAVAALAGYRGNPEVDQRLKDLERQMLIKDFIAQTRELYDLLPGDAERAERLLRWLSSPRPFLRETALDIIYQPLKKKGVVPSNGVLQKVRTMLDDPDESVRKNLVEVLRELQQLEDARLLEARLEQEKSPAVRELIYHALGYIRDPKSIPVCVRGLTDPVDSVAARAASALGDLAEFIKPASAPQALESAVDGLLERASGGIGDDELRERVIDAMASIADKKFLAVLAKHAGPDESQPAIRQAALRGIGRIGDPAQADLVIKRLAAEQDPGLREAAVEALGKLGSKLEHLEPLRERLDAKVEPSAAVHQKAWEAYRLVFMKLTPADQQRVIASWPDEVIRLMVEAQLPQESRQDIAGRLLDFARGTGKRDPQAALSFLDKLTQAIPPEQAGASWAKQLAAVRKELQAATRPAATRSGG